MKRLNFKSSEWKRRGKKNPESKSLTQLFQEGLSIEWENGILRTKSFSGISIICIGLSLFLCIFGICRIFQCNFAWIVQDVWSLVCLPSFPFERWQKEIIYGLGFFVCVYTHSLNTELSKVVYWAWHSCNKPISNLSFVPILQEIHSSLL